MKPISRHEKLYTRVTPIFDGHMGKRMATARMLTLRTQKEVAALLSTPEYGVSQSTVSDIEKGSLRFSGFSLARLEAVFGRHVNFILFGTQAERYDERHIAKRFWQYKNAPKGNRKTVRSGVPCPQGQDPRVR